MTERKPNNVSWESWIERQIQDGQREGAFERLHGHGRPIDGLGAVHDDMWWVKAKLRGEYINYLPPTIAIRAERAAAIDAAMQATTETEVRTLLDDVNVRIRYVNSHASAGPPSSVVTIDPEVILERWRVIRPPPESALVVGSDRHQVAAIRPRRRWQPGRWLRRRRRVSGLDGEERVGGDRRSDLGNEKGSQPW